MKKLFVILSLLFLLAGTAESKSIQTFIFRIGGNSLGADDEIPLSKFDIVILNKYFYDDCAADCFQAIRDENADVEIYTYVLPAGTRPSHDYTNVESINNIARYQQDCQGADASRGHSEGNLNCDNDSYFLKNSGGDRCFKTTLWWLAFGDSNVQDYITEAVIADSITGRAWSADGVYIDEMTVTTHSFSCGTTIYNPRSVWQSNMTSFLTAFNTAIEGESQKVLANRGRTRYDYGETHWLAVDQSANPVYGQCDEAAFISMWGGSNGQFYPEADWKRQVDLPSQISNSQVLYQAYIKTASGVDNYGDSLDYWRPLWYSIASYLLARPIVNNMYLYFNEMEPASGPQGYDQVDTYWDEYDIEIGDPLGAYSTQVSGSATIYYREYDLAWVYVNPSGNHSGTFNLEEAGRERTHANLATAVEDLSSVTTTQMNRHTGKIFYKSVLYDPASIHKGNTLAGTSNQ